VHEWISVHLTRGREEEPRPIPKRTFEEMTRPGTADVENLEGHRREIIRRCRTRQIEHGIEGVRTWAIGRQRLGDIGMDEREPGMRDEMIDIARSPGRQIVDRHDVVAAGQECVAEMGADESGSAGKENAHPQRPIPS
jgi:hypothetical protein